MTRSTVLSRGTWFMSALLMTSTTVPASEPPSFPGYAVTPTCDAACLEGFANRYFAALPTRAAARLPWADKVRFSENNVWLHVGDGLWGTATAAPSKILEFTDVQTGQVGALGLVEQRGQLAFFALRLKVVDGRIAEAETLINQPDRSRPPSPLAGDPDALVHYAAMSQVLAPAQRTPRRRMVDLANGYFSTLQLNDGKLFTAFTDDCRRQENGFETTLNPKFDRPEAKLSCGEQFKTGTFIFDTAVRDRDYMLVDEPHGLVLARAFIDHNAAATEDHLADGSVVKSYIRSPNSLCMLELFHITSGRIDRIEVVHIDVPYGMPSVWRRNDE
ncbi:MAG TPA: hypothetical protein VN750_19750 [Steroidobacteraceae bacterium]|nr:hypothetical protein [Steroidobacteraceae bacterium]